MHPFFPEKGSLQCQHTAPSQEELLTKTAALGVCEIQTPVPDSLGHSQTCQLQPMSP